MLGKIRPQSIRELVFQKIRKEILTGKLTPGEKLVESELAKSLEVSRTPVREALHRLEQEGLVQVFPRKYSLVKGITDDCIYEINLIRASLEPEAAKNAVTNLTDKELEHLANLLDESELYFQNDDIENLLRIHDEFHQTIISASRLPRIIQILANMHDYIVRFRIAFLSRPELVSRSIHEHRLILDAMQQRDKERVKKLFEEHLYGISEYANVALEQNKKMEAFTHVRDDSLSE